MGRMLVVAYTAICLLANLVHSFTTQSPAARTRYFALRVIDNEDDGIVGDETIPDFGEGDLQVAGVTIDDLSWRVERLRLEEQNRRRFLKARPRFLPYDECRKWVQAFNRWSSEKEWYVNSSTLRSRFSYAVLRYAMLY